MTYLPLLLSFAHFGSHLPPRSPDRRGGPSGKVGTIPRAVGGCTCPACDPARAENVYRAPVAKGQRHRTRAQRKAANLLTNARRSELIAWLDRADRRFQGKS